MTFQELYTESVVQIIKEKAEEKKNQIFVILGQADLIKDNWLNDNLSDSDTFLKNGSESVFNKNWFTRIFTQLNIVKDLHLLSYAQFSYLVNYIDNSFAYKRNIISDEKNFEISSNLLVSYTYDTYIQGKVINTDGASEAFIKIKQVPCTRDYGPILEDKKSPVFITKQKILNFNFYPNPVVEYLIIELNEPIQKIEVKNLLGQSVNFNLLKQEKNKYQLNFTEKGFQNKRQSIFKHKSQ